MSKETEGATTEGAEGAEGTEEPIVIPDDFDAERAMKTILTQRAAEAKLKDDKAALEAELAKYRKAEEDKAEEAKSLELKLAEKDARIAELERKEEQAKIKNDFVEKATARGYESPTLAFLAAREQGLLGEYDPKTGEVGDHDFEALEESHEQFATEAGRSGEGATGDAGTRGGGTASTPNSTFNKLVRQSL